MQHIFMTMLTNIHALKADHNKGERNRNNNTYLPQLVQNGSKIVSHQSQMISD